MTGTKLAETIFSHFSVIEDPRAPNGVHSFDNILFCAVVGVLCGADGFVQLERIQHVKKDFLAEHIDLRARIPSHDTI
ncbi:MAG: transposase family protein, partial [Deltaproteobacteria bacterium]|nr:transposase family protein [Deltaproteobacteria bacterium]